MTKYRAKPVDRNGKRFASRREADRYDELRLMERAGLIGQLKCQVPFELAPGVKLDGDKRKRPPVRYVADFTYVDHDAGIVVEDTKGFDTPMSRLKRHLMATQRGIMVRIVR